jgi:hypothetical protein
VAIPNVEIRVLDDDLGGLLIVESGGDTRVLEGVPVSGGSSAIDDTVNVRLSVAPDADVTVDIAHDVQVQVFHNGVQVNQLMFTPANWDQDLTLTIKAVNDSVRENPRNAFVSFSFTSDDAVYDGAPPAELEVRVLDDDSARVLVTESEGKTKVVRGVSGDDYTLRLVSQPTGNVNVNVYEGEVHVTGAKTVGASDDRLVLVDLGAAQTVIADLADNAAGADAAARRDTITRTDGGSWLADGYRIGTLFTLGSGPVLYKVNDIAEVIDADTGEVTRSTLTLTTDGALASATGASVTLQSRTHAVTFTSANWHQEVRVSVDADPNFLPDVSQQFVRQEPFREHVVAQISGPLIIEGGVAEGKDRSLNPAIMLPAESTALPLDVDVLTDETEQADRLNLFNDSSAADDQGWMSAVTLDNALVHLDAAINISGLGMRPDPATGMSTSLTVDISEAQDGSQPVEFFGGITFDDIEITEILLGQGNDSFNIDATSTGTPGAGGYVVTVVHGGGNAALTDADGNFIDADGQPSNEPVIGGDSIVVTGGGGTGSPLVIYGDTSQDGSRYDSRPDDGVFTGNGLFYADPGNDTIDARGADGMVALYGGAGADTIWGSAFGDHLAGGSGDDHIHGEDGKDHIYGDSGFNLDFAVSKDEDTDAAIVARLLTVPTANASPILTGDAERIPTAGGFQTGPLIPAGSDTITGGLDQDIIFGDHGVIDQEAGTLRLLTTAFVTRITSNEWTNGAADEIHGNDGNDVILGGAGGDTIYAGSGNDLVFGDQGRVQASGTAAYFDAVYLPAVQNGPVQFTAINTDVPTGAGDDLVYAGEGDDTVLGQQGADLLYGEGGDDDLIGGHNVAGGLMPATTSTAARATT